MMMPTTSPIARRASLIAASTDARSYRSSTGGRGSFTHPREASRLADSGLAARLGRVPAHDRAARRSPLGSSGVWSAAAYSPCNGRGRSLPRSPAVARLSSDLLRIRILLPSCVGAAVVGAVLAVATGGSGGVQAGTAFPQQGGPVAVIDVAVNAY